MKHIFMLFFVMCFAKVQTQTMAIWGYAGSSVFGVPTGGKQPESFETFRQSYNILNKDFLKDELSKPRVQLGGSFGFGCNMGAFYCEVGYMSLNSRSKAAFADGKERVIDFKYNQYLVAIGLGIFKPNFYLAGIANINLGIGNQLLASTKYPDGTVSYGNENILNGEYEATSFGVSYGLRFGLGSEEFKFFVAADLMKSSKDAGSFSDFFAGTNAIEGRVGDNSEIGTDWAAYTNGSGNYILGDGKLLGAAHDGIVIRVGIQLRLWGI